MSSRYVRSQDSKKQILFDSVGTTPTVTDTSWGQINLKRLWVHSRIKELNQNMSLILINYTNVIQSFVENVEIRQCRFR